MLAAQHGRKVNLSARVQGKRSITMLIFLQLASLRAFLINLTLLISFSTQSELLLGSADCPLTATRFP